MGNGTECNGTAQYIAIIAMVIVTILSLAFSWVQSTRMGAFDGIQVTVTNNRNAIVANSREILGLSKDIEYVKSRVDEILRALKGP